MRVLHSSDWHLGRSLYGRKRYEEFEAFLAWLLETIEAYEVEVLLVSGDIFDTTTPSHRAQSLYYGFLERVAVSRCRHVVITGGNHDSPSFLAAPSGLLRALDVHVVASASLADEVVVLRKDGKPEAIVCAVPYLRDRDVRTSEAGESSEEKAKKLRDGISEHYARVGALAEAKRASFGVDLPIIGMGHLFTLGGQLTDDDGVRELYVGNLAHVGAEIFPDCFDYVALGHLHVPQMVKGLETIRYSGSPIPMGFGEAKQQKILCLVDFEQGEVAVKTIDIPVFQKLERIKGDWEAISERIAELKALDESLWLEVSYDSHEVMADLPQRLAEFVEDSALEILAIKRMRIKEAILSQFHVDEKLDDLDVYEVFDRCLMAKEVPEEQREALRASYREICISLWEDDRQAE